MNVTGVQTCALPISFYFRAVLYGAAGGGININGDIKTFTTGGDAAPTATTKIVATTGDASGVTSSTATLNGMLNPEGVSVSAWFDWGTSSSLGNRTEVQTIAEGTNAVPVTFLLKNLHPQTTYFFRLDG